MRPTAEQSAPAMAAQSDSHKASASKPDAEESIANQKEDEDDTKLADLLKIDVKPHAEKTRALRKEPSDNKVGDARRSTTSTQKGMVRKSMMSTPQCGPL